MAWRSHSKHKSKATARRRRSTSTRYARSVGTTSPDSSSVLLGCRNGPVTSADDDLAILFIVGRCYFGQAHRPLGAQDVHRHAALRRDCGTLTQNPEVQAGIAQTLTDSLITVDAPPPGRTMVSRIALKLYDLAEAVSPRASGDRPSKMVASEQFCQICAEAS